MDVTPAPRVRVSGQLTPRELALLRGMALGQTNKEIGAQHFMAPETVKTHARMLFAKLGVRTRGAAVAVAHEHGLFGGPTPSDPDRLVAIRTRVDQLPASGLRSDFEFLLSEVDRLSTRGVIAGDG